MKRSKNMLILLGILVICVIAYAAISVYNKKAEEKELQGDVLFSVKAENVQTLTVSDMTFIKEDGTWVSLTDESVSVSQSLMEAYLEEVTKLGYQRSISNTELDEGTDMGFSNAPMISYADNTGVQYKLELGSENEFVSLRYLRVNGNDIVFYMVANEASALFEKSMKDFVEQEKMPDLSQATSITITNENGVFAWSNTGVAEDDGHHIWKRDDNTIVDTGKVENFLSQMTNIVWDAFVTHRASEADLSTYGLDNPVASITVEAPMDTVTLNIGAKPDESYYVQISGSSMVYKLIAVPMTAVAVNAEYFDGTTE